MSRFTFVAVVLGFCGLSSCTRDLTLPEAPGPGSVSGRVVLAEPGSTDKRPIAGAEVRVLGSGLATSTSPGGTFTLENLELTSGLLLVRVEVNGVSRQQVLQLADFGTGPRRKVDVGDVVIGENARVRGKALRGDLLPARGGHAGTTVFVPAGPFTTLTADDGSFSLDQMPEGPVELFVFRSGYEPMSLGGLRLRSGETVELREVTLSLASSSAPGSVRGALDFLPATSGRGDSTVRLVSTDGTVQVPVADELTFRAADVPVGLYRLEARRSGYSNLDVLNVLVVSGRETNFGTLTLTTAPPFDPGPPPVTPDAGPEDAGFDAGVDAGIDAGLDAGAGQLCAVQSDCSQGYWCDVNRCVPLCLFDSECGFGRVCDTAATRTCVRSCQGQCPAGQTCDGTNVCRGVCDATFPCPSGQRCSTGLCVPECSVSADCNNPFLGCDLGICKRTGRCASDQDCLREELCVIPSPDAGQCGGRPTDAGVRPDGGVWSDGGLVFACGNPCHCRSGERCADGFCEADVIPTRFIALGADGGGGSASSPSGTLAIPDGGVVGLLAADTWDLGTQTLGVPGNTHVAGGFSVCGTNRWVRERSARTLLTSVGTAPSGGAGVLASTGSFATPTSRSAVSGLTLRGTGTARCAASVSSFRYAHDLLVEDVDVDLQVGPCSGASLRTIGMLVEDSNTVTVRRVRLLDNAGGGNTPSAFLSVSRSNGLVEDVSAAPVAVVNDYRAVELLNPSGATTVRRLTLGRFNGRGTTSSTSQLAVQGCADVPVQLEDLAAAWQVANTTNGGSGYPVFIDACNDVTLRRVDISGAGHPGVLYNQNFGLWLRNSGGTAEDLTISIPTPGQSVAAWGGLMVEGPRATWAISRAQVTATGGTSVTSTLGVQGIRIGGQSGGQVVQGPLTIQDSEVFIRGNNSPVGLYAQNVAPAAQFSFLDGSVDVGGTNQCGYDVLAVLANGGARLERNTITAANGAFASAVYAKASGRLELYGNALRVGLTSGTASCGALGSSSIYGGYALAAENGAAVRAIGNTLDPGGQSGSGVTIGVACATSSIVLASNIISSGLGTEARLLSPAQTGAPPATACFSGSSTITNNYFVNGSASPVSPQERLFDAGVVLNGGMGTGNTFGGTTSCFAAPAVLGDGGLGFPYFLTPGSACADLGAIGTRLDGSPVTLDLFGLPRDGGAGPDIGAVEGP